MDAKTAKKFFNQPNVVEFYSQAANQVGLWESEEVVFQKAFSKDSKLLELGCGAGRIAIGLWEIGYHDIIGIDLSRNMVKEARRIAKMLNYPIDFRHGDATSLSFANNSFDGAIFGFNGLMQIPKKHNRQKAMAEVARVLKPGSYFIFTSHDRNNPKNKKHWQDEAILWNSGQQEDYLDDFGDMYRQTKLGAMYIYSPLLPEVQDDLENAGFVIETQMPRSSIAIEPKRVTDFSDDCRFWVARKR